MHFSGRIGRGSVIRTHGPLLPKQVLYQAELCPVPYDRLVCGLPFQALRVKPSGQKLPQLLEKAVLDAVPWPDLKSFRSPAGDLQNCRHVTPRSDHAL